MREIKNPDTPNARIEEIKNKLWYIEHKWGAAKQLADAIEERTQS